MLKKALTIVFGTLLLDQVLKIWIKLHYKVGDVLPLCGEWFRLHFIENPGMAFGMEFGGHWGKLALSLFRVIAIGGIGYYLFKMVKDKAPKGFVYAVALIFAGAIGNIIDSAVYGVLFSESDRFTIANFLPAEGGYAPFLFGYVVDMLQFDVYWPSWVPSLGGTPVFSPIFNIADVAISTGVGWVILKHKTYLGNDAAKANQEQA